MVKSSNKIEYSILILFLFSFLLGAATIIAGQKFHLDEKLLDKAEHKFGREARSLLVSWEDLINHDTSLTDHERLKRVNDFFNRLEFVDDSTHWGKKDYWATPIEFLGSRGGDCEDFTIAKYFTLKAMGVAEERLNLTYVKALHYNVPHMVLTYYATPDAEPLVLDNLVKDIKRASERSDLIPIYSFNGTGLWLAKQRGRGKLFEGTGRLQLWQDLMQRMSEDIF